jgi:hypothetical protein
MTALQTHNIAGPNAQTLTVADVSAYLLQRHDERVLQAALMHNLPLHIGFEVFDLHERG